MTNSPFGDDAYQPRTVDLWDENSQYAPTPGNFGRIPATLYSPSRPSDCATEQLHSDQPSGLLYKIFEGSLRHTFPVSYFPSYYMAFNFFYEYDPRKHRQVRLDPCPISIVFSMSVRCALGT
ncbi:unnamed protein product [Penicillium camemberti]|uniref:Str. FM013 n=1 Tax=Penicillium camemberti (strain FM 013) TaxID=1429867 RepID=A0A0G4PXE1_PENC3|nr:unnamed protein product [Penicillium camemberti]